MSGGQLWGWKHNGRWDELSVFWSDYLFKSLIVPEGKGVVCNYIPIIFSMFVMSKRESALRDNGCQWNGCRLLEVMPQFQLRLGGKGKPLFRNAAGPTPAWSSKFILCFPCAMTPSSSFTPTHPMGHQKSHCFIPLVLYSCRILLHDESEWSVRAHSLNCVWLFAIPWTVTHQDPLSMGFFRQEYWSGLPFPPGDLPDPGIEPTSSASPALIGRFFTTELPEKPRSEW